MKIKIVTENKIGNIFSVYAPQVDRPEAEKEAFWCMVTAVAESEVQLVAGDLNGHIGEEVMGAHGFGVRNQEVKRILVC